MGLDAPVDDRSDDPARERDDASDVLGEHGRHTARYVSLAVGAVLAVFVTFLFTRDSDGGAATSPLLGDLVPATEGADLDGAPYDIDDHRGEWVAVNFFAHWCGPCRQEHPQLLEFAARHADAGDASLVSVAFDDTPDDAREFFDELGGEWPVLVEDTASIGVNYGVTGVPETYLIAPDGTVAALWREPVTAEALDATIAELSAPASEDR
jgi:cytochrome c biogenesis protein CcmG, thiol:disulfide interchange protein DsbE